MEVKYKAGDELVVKCKITKVDKTDKKFPYLVTFENDKIEWFSEKDLTGAKEEPVSSKVKLTKTQEAYLLSFGENVFKVGSFEFEKAIYYISRQGFGFPFTDGEDKDFYPGKKFYLHDNFDTRKVKELLITALVNGYELEKELYTVEIPGPSHVIGKLVLAKYSHSECFISETRQKNWKNKVEYQLTEEEIKKDFKYLWQFAEPVPKR